MNQSPVARPGRFQVPLSYLIYLVTLIALAMAIFRRVLALGGGWQLTAILSTYLAAMIAYFAFRFPILLRRLQTQKKSLAAQRAEAEHLVKEARRQTAGGTNEGEQGE